LKQGESAIAENFTAVTIPSADIVGFTRLASRRSAFETELATLQQSPAEP